MYSYDAASGDLRCVSCDPTGAPPAESVRGSTAGLFMSDDGRTFWATRDPLVPFDTNKLLDVYEFVEGRPQLISSGTSDRDESFEGRVDAGLSGVSADGINVYFVTFDTLVVQDKNGPYAKFYDARTNGGFPPPPVELPCVAADECHGDTNPAPPAPRVVSTGDLGAGGNVVEKKSGKGKKKKKHKQRAKRRRSAGRHHRGGGVDLDGQGDGPDQAVRGAGEPGRAAPPRGRQLDGERHAQSRMIDYEVRPSTTQAGGHPNLEVFLYIRNTDTLEDGSDCNCADARNIIIDMPAGVIADPHALPQCDDADFAANTCPISSQIGLIRIGFDNETPPRPAAVPVSRLQPHDPSGTGGSVRVPGPDPQLAGLHHRQRADRGRLRPQSEHDRHHPRPRARDQRPRRENLGDPGGPCQRPREARPAGMRSHPHEPRRRLRRRLFIDQPAPGLPEQPDHLRGAAPRRSRRPVVRPLSGVDLGAVPGDHGMRRPLRPEPRGNPTTTEHDTASGVDVVLSVPQFQDPNTPSPSELKESTITFPKGFSLNPAPRTER